MGAAALAGLCAATAVAAPPDIDRPATAFATARRLGTTASPTIGGCPVFPADNAWNTSIAAAPLHPRSAAIVSTILANGGDFLHPDFGENPDYGIPYVVVPASEPSGPIVYDAYGDESDPGPVPDPADRADRGWPGGDRRPPRDRRPAGHVRTVRAVRRAHRRARAGSPQSGARFDLRSNALRPLGWTSADAAGLPIFPGLVRYEEVASGQIRHAIRITFSRTQAGYILPATHFASNRTDPNLPADGPAPAAAAPSYDVSRLTGQARVIAVAMQQYGVIVADNGSNWFFQGAPSPGWNDDDLNQLKSVPGSAFEVVDTGPVLT